MFAWQATVQDEQGVVVVNPSVTVYLPDGVTLALIYNEDGSPKANPFIGTLEGFVQFWAQAGGYRVEGIDGAEQTYTWEIVLGGECLGNNRVYSIGPTGDFHTINDFLSFGAAYLPVPNKNYAPSSQAVWRGQPVITAVIQPTFTMTEQVFIDGGDYSHIEIWGPSGINAAQNIVVPVQASAITKVAPANGGFNPVFYGRSCMFPRVRAKFALDGSGAGLLIRGAHFTNSWVFFTGGVTDCTERGGVVYDGFADLSGSVWDRAAHIGIRPANQATVLLTGASAKGCGHASGGGSGERAGLHARGARVDGIGLDLSGCLGEAAIFSGCEGRIEGLNVSGAATNGLRASGTSLFISGLNASGCGNIGVTADRSAFITIQLGNVSGCLIGVDASNASKVDAQQVNADGCGTAFRATFASEISFRSGRGINCTNAVGVVESGSTVVATACNFTGYGGSTGVTARGLSRVDLQGSTVIKTDAVARSTDVDYYTGSQINMTGATGGWQGMPATNAINGSRGIVWKQ